MIESNPFEVFRKYKAVCPEHGDLSPEANSFWRAMGDEIEHYREEECDKAEVHHINDFG